MTELIDDVKTNISETITTKLKDLRKKTVSQDAVLNLRDEVLSHCDFELARFKSDFKGQWEELKDMLDERCERSEQKLNDTMKGFVEQQRDNLD
jgi:hypothetical protein